MSRDIERYAEDYLKDGFEKVMSSYRRQMIVRLLQKYVAKNILEVGPAYNFCYQAYPPFTRYTVVEPSSIMCARMPREKNVRIINDFLENSMDLLRQENFDFIIFSGLLHEIEDESSVLKCLYSLCGPETIVHISVPNCKSFHLRFAYEAGLISEIGKLTPYSQKMQRCRTYDKSSLKKALRDVGFSIAEEGNFFLKLFNQKKMQQCSENGILDRPLLDALARMGDLVPDAAAEIYCNVKKGRTSDA